MNLFSKRNLPLLIIFGVGIGLFTLLTLLNSRIVGSDDTVFQSQILPYSNIFEWVAYRYETWSGRIFSEGAMYIFSSAPLLYWKIVNIAMFGLFTFATFGIYRLVNRGTNSSKDAFALVMILSLPFLFDKFVLADGGIWITGSIGYFWPATLALAGMYPIAYYLVKHRLAKWPLIILGSISLLTAVGFQEQIGTFVCAFLAIASVYQFVTTTRKGKVVTPWYLIVLFVLSTALFCVSVAAPGNSARLELETLKWLPDLPMASILERIEYGYRWVIDGLINHSGFLLPLIWLALGGLFFIKKKRTMIDNIFVYSFVIAAIFLLANGFESIAYWFNFYATWRPVIPNPYISLNLVPWSLLLLLTALAPMRLFPNEGFGKLVSLLICGSFACAAIITLSPTIYASGFRTLFVPSFILMISWVLLSTRLLDKRRALSWVVVIICVALATSHFLYQLVRLIST